jgi:hypothetical protein
MWPKRHLRGGGYESGSNAENADICFALAEKTKLTNLPGCATYAWPQRGEPLQTTRIGSMAPWRVARAIIPGSTTPPNRV